jgi:hypothetical protein
MDWTRPELDRAPPGRGGDALVFLEIHGAFPPSPPVASTSAYRLAPEVADAVEVVRLDRGGGALDARRAGVSWQWFAGDHPALAARVASAPQAMIVRAELHEPRSLAYLRHAVGLAQLLLDHGGLAVHDVQTLRWYPADEWRAEAFTEDFRPHAHVVVLTSLDGERAWLHTRGMRKFGRPDLSVVRVPDEHRDAALALVNRLIAVQARGGALAEGQPVEDAALPSGLVCRHKGDLEDPDFNNVHVEIAFPD